jgi:hypothetical protein
MRRTILAFCTAAIILACGILTPVTASAEEARGCAQHTMNGIHAGTMTGLYILIKFFGGMVHMVRCMRTAVFTIYMMKFILDVPCADTLIMNIR